jgi:outer membrane protein OmpA-like peptidoglycan-associated protein
MTRKKPSFSSTTAAALALLALTQAIGCATPAKDTGYGAAAGGGVGALVGGLAGGWKGAAIGAGIGALAGGTVGNYLDKQTQELKQVADTQRTQNGILVNLKNDLTFDTAQAMLKPDSQAQLTQLGDILSKYPKDRIRVEGFTDSSGGKSFNQLLSQQRAQTVVNVLVQRGVKSEQITAQGLGTSAPLASNTSANGRAKNRRVELHIDVPDQKTS